VFTEAGKDQNGVPYPAALFATGPASAAPDLTLHPDTLRTPGFHFRSGVPTGGDLHGGMDVPLYAWGPPEAIAAIGASLDNTEVFAILAPLLRAR
jgi:alkaline phosphatase